MLFISGIIFFVGAVIMKYKPPKKINSLYGYRTSLSMSSDRAWHLAQQHSTKAMFKYSLLMIVVGLLTGFSVILDKYVELILIIEIVILLPLLIVMMMLSTHNYLKRTLH